MEWGLVLALVLAAAALIALPGLLRTRERFPAATDPADALVEERRLLLAELRDLDEDLAAGRISPADRQQGRRALAPRLRAVTEALRAAGAAPAPGRGPEPHT